MADIVNKVYYVRENAKKGNPKWYYPCLNLVFSPASRQMTKYMNKGPKKFGV